MPKHAPFDRRRTQAQAVDKAVTWFERWLQRAVPATPKERAAALWSFAYFFTLLAGYYVLRPLRDQMAIAGGVKALPWLFTATFVALLAAQPLYGALVARLPRARFIPFVNHFFVANLALFWMLLTFDIETVIVARVFFVWVSVFNLFVVAVFWSFMADLFTSEQGKRLFGFIGAGGTAGALLAVYVVGFAALALAPSLIVVVIVQVAQRWMNFAIANPARQVFYTVVAREEKYKAKNLIDVVVYRGSDALYGWVFDGMQALGLKLGAIALCALPVVAGWLVLSAALGRAQERRAAHIAPELAQGD